jgi:hypothetical protein
MFLQLNKKNNLTVLSIIAFIFLISFSAFNFLVKSQNEIESFKSATLTEIPHNLVGTYYNLRDYSGKFLLNNKGIETITVYPTLYNMSGQLITIPPETVNASSHRLIDLNNWASLGGESFKEGSIKIFHTGKDLVLGTQIYLENDNESSSFDEKLAELTKFDTRKQEAVWWMPNRQTDVKIALSNTSDTVLSINATLSRKPKKIGVTENFTLQPHQTRLLDLRNDFTDGSQFDAHDVIGLSLEHAGAKDALLARIMLKNETLGYSNVVQFSNPNTAKSNEYQGVGFHIDKLGGTQLEPIIIAKNVGTTDSNIQIKIPYTRSNGTTDTIILPIEKLKSGEMSQINANLITNIALQENIKVAGIEVTYDTQNGSVIVAAHSVSPNRNQVYRVPMWDPLQQKSPTGGYPWRIEPTSTTKVYIKNITDQEEDYVAFLLWENGGEYMIGLKAIKPNQSIEIDVKKLRDDQTPDERGRIIPLNINNGQLQWTLRRKDTLPDDDAKGNLALVGRSEQIDFVKNTSSNYACQNCCAGDFAGGYIEAAIPSQTGPITAGTSRVYFAVEEQETCYGGLYGFYNPVPIYNAVWATSNSNIATVSGGLVSGINQGDAEVTAAWYPRSSYVIPCGPPQQFVNPDGTLCNEKDEIFQSIKPAKEDDPTIFTKLAACGSCTLRRWTYAYVASKFVSVAEPDFTITVPPTAKDGSTVTFSSTITRGTPVSYQWSFTSPTGAGNNPQVNFATPNGAATTAKAHWFALPNTDCATSPPQASETHPYWNSSYKIKLKVTFQGGREISKESDFNVNSWWNPGGSVAPATNSGGPQTAFDKSRQLYVVLNSGTMARNTNSAVMNIPATSQFYNKILTHEQKHELQWQSGLYQNVRSVSSFMAVISNFTDTTSAGLSQQINQAFSVWDLQQAQLYINNISAAELEAYAISDLLAPQFAYQRCGRTMFP